MSRYPSHLLPSFAPPAYSVRLLASAFGASACGVRFSSRSFSGLVVVAHFPQHSQARHFAPVAARLSGSPFCVVRGSSVSVPVCPVSPLALRQQPPAPARPGSSCSAVVVVNPARPAQCQAYTRSGSQCSRPPTHGHYCHQHYKVVA